MSNATDRVKREVDETKRSVQDAKEQLSEAMRSVGGPPAENEDQAVKQIEDVRAQLERDLSALRARIADPKQYLERYGDQARTIGLAVAGGAVTLVTTVRVMKRRSAKKEHAERVREQAAAIAHELAKIEFHEIAEEERGSGRKLVLLSLAAVGAGAGFWIRRRSQQQRDIEVWGPADVPPAPAGAPEGRGAAEGATPVGATVPTGAAPRMERTDEIPPIPGTDPIPPATPRTPGEPPA